MSDYRTLLLPAYDGPDGPFAANTIAAILATPIPDLCPDCKGTDIVRSSKTPPPGFEFTLAFCGHANAPTIADRLALADRAYELLLAVTELVIWMSGSPSFGPGGEGHDEWVRAREAVLKPALASLRGEGQ